jgi:hypothetical protein
MPRRKLSAAEIEKEQVEQVFMLGGGELNHEPWTVKVPEPGLTSHPTYRPARGARMQSETFPYWYEGPPEYAEEFRGYRHEGTYRTVVADCLYGLPPVAVADRDGVWKRVAEFRSSGERECPWEGVDDIPTVMGRHGRQGTKVLKAHTNDGKECSLCSANVGEAHGYVFLGEGWYEIVYQLIEQPAYAESPEWDQPHRGHGRDVAAYVHQHHAAILAAYRQAHPGAQYVEPKTLQAWVLRHRNLFPDF